MTFSFYLKDKNRANGTPLILIIHQGGKQYKKAIGITVRPADFKKQRVKNEAVNNKLRSIENRLNEKLNQFSTEEDILDAIQYALTGEQKTEEMDGLETPSFWEYYEIWSNRDCPQKRQRRNNYKLVKETMGSAYDWDTVDSGFYLLLVRRLQDAGYSVNYIGTIISRLKAMMNEAAKLRYHSNTDFHSFRRMSEQPDTVYLTQKEIEKLWRLKLTIPREKKTRDLFILGCYTAMRFSDYSRLEMDMIQDGLIRISQKKTGGRVVIPASPRVIEILQRNGGCAPKVCHQQFNKTIKEVCKKAKIDTPITVTKSKGVGRVIEIKPKYELVCSHSARRSAISNLHLSGLPLHQLMLVSGHKSLQSLQRYLRLTAEENARMLAENPFFK
jgi:integrase